MTATLTRPKIKVNGSRLVRSVRRHARQNPDKKAKCKYVVNRKPECIIGCALADEGLLDLPSQFDSASGTVNPSFKMMANEQISISERYARWLEEVQAAQDGRTRHGRQLTWAEAVAYADKVVGKVW